jgi:hypothetical protein
MTIPNSTFTEILSTTLHKYQPSFADNVTNRNALLSRIRDNGNMRVINKGGATIQRQLAYAENATFQYYSGYETLNVSASDTLTSSSWDWKQASVYITISGLEKAINGGASQIIDLVSSRTKVAMMTMANSISSGLYSDGTGSGGKQIGGLQLIVADDPSTGTVGGIDGGAHSVWRNVTFDASTDGGTAATSSNIISYMNTLFNNISLNGDEPDLIIADSNYYALYQQALQSIQRITVSTVGSAGFRSLDYQGVPVVLDNNVPANHMYFLNTKNLYFDVHADRNFSAGEMMRPVNQDAFVMPILFMGNLTCDNRRNQGVLKA